jgi:hypothetical protein
VARAGTPGRDLTDELDVHGDVLDPGSDRVAVQIAAEGVLADAHIAPVAGGGEFLRLPFGDPVEAGAVREIEIDPIIGASGRPMSVKFLV